MSKLSKLVPFLSGGTAAIALCFATPAAAQSPRTVTDGEWLTLSGSVVSSTADGFMLDYGSKTILVEMDDYDWYSENPVLKGDKVTVTGRMDADFLETRKIEASSVYLKSLNTMYFANAADEEGLVVPILRIDPLTDGETVSLTGKIVAINGKELTLDAGLLNYKVDVSSVKTLPFDKNGVARLTVGDRISITGKMDDADLFDKREIDAQSLTELG